MAGFIHHDSSSDELRETFARRGFVTASDVMVPVLRQALKVASASDVTALLEGETGTGKQVLARVIHELDPKRAKFAFVTAHCSTINETLAESELFGHLRGAFTGAITQRLGLFQTADQGTLFLDEINDLPLCLQSKLLDAMQRSVVRPLGSDREVAVSTRIIAASNQNLHSLVLQQRFRADLFYRLNVVRLYLPLLRDRPGDLGPLVLSFAAKHKSLYQPILSIEPDLIKLMREQPFGGNVRELEHVVVRMLFAKQQGTSLSLEDWFAQTGEARTETDRDFIGEAADNLWQCIFRNGLSYSEALQSVEKKLLTTALLSGGRTRQEVAQKLRTSERTLYNMIRTHRLGSRVA